MAKEARTTRMVDNNLYNILNGLKQALFEPDMVDADRDEYAQKGAKQVRANETPGKIDGLEKGVDNSNTIPKEGRVVVKARINEEEAVRTADEKAEERSRQKGDSQKGISR